VVIAAHPRARGSRCRRCGRVSTRVHSRYRRHLADLPVSGRPVDVWLTIRRFFCDHVDCSACTFVEQVPGLTERHAQRSPGLRAALVAIGLALAGRAGSRLAIRLGMRASRSTLLRLIRALPDPPVCECSNYLAHFGRAIWRYLALPAAGDVPPACLHRGWRPFTKARCEPNNSIKVSHLPVTNDTPGDQPGPRGLHHRHHQRSRQLDRAHLHRSTNLRLDLGWPYDRRRGHGH